MNEINKHKTGIMALCKKHKVNSLYVFGSILSDKFKKNSDIDLLVSFKNIDLLEYADNYFDFLFSLEDLFKRKVDLVTEKSLSNPYFIKSINESKQLIYGG